MLLIAKQTNAGEPDAAEPVGIDGRTESHEEPAAHPRIEVALPDRSIDREPTRLVDDGPRRPGTILRVAGAD